MYEVILSGNRWTWQLISAAGRVIVSTPLTYPCDATAAEAARRYRAEFWRVADQVDHRQARCI